MSAATIGFDATAAVRQSAGIGRYTRELLSALVARQDDLRYRLLAFTGGQSEGHLPSLDRRFTVRTVPLSDRLANAVWHRARFPLPVQSLIGTVRLFHSPDFTLPPVPRTPTVLTVHDLAFLTVPDTAYPTLRQYLEEVVPRSVRRADRIVAVSECTRQDLVERLGVPEDRVTVIHEAASPAFHPMPVDDRTENLLHTLGVARPFILAVGTIQPRKNYPRLLDAFALLRERHPGVSLLIAGQNGWMSEPVFERLSALGLEEVVRIVNPNDEMLGRLYSACAATVYPSLYEGFGIPPLEAMACGAPVICSNTSSLPEVVGDAALTVDPTDVEAIAVAMATVLEDEALAACLGDRGLLRAEQFSWERAAAQTVQLYREVLSGA